MKGSSEPWVGPTVEKGRGRVLEREGDKQGAAELHMCRKGQREENSFRCTILSWDLLGC